MNFVLGSLEETERPRANSREILIRHRQGVNAIRLRRCQSTSARIVSVRFEDLTVRIRDLRDLGLRVIGEGGEAVLRPRSEASCEIYSKLFEFDGLVSRRSRFQALRVKCDSEGRLSCARRGAGATALVKVMRIPYLGRRMTMGRASMLWPGAS